MSWVRTEIYKWSWDSNNYYKVGFIPVHLVFYCSSKHTMLGIMIALLCISLSVAQMVSVLLPAGSHNSFYLDLVIDLLMWLFIMALLQGTELGKTINNMSAKRTSVAPRKFPPLHLSPQPFCYLSKRTYPYVLYQTLLNDNYSINDF